MHPSSLVVSSREVRAGATLLSANANLIRPIGQDSWRMEVDSTSLPRSPDPSLPCLAQVHPSLIHPCAVLPKPIQTYPPLPCLTQTYPNLSTPVLSCPSLSKLIQLIQAHLFILFSLSQFILSHTILSTFIQFIHYYPIWSNPILCNSKWFVQFHPFLLKLIRLYPLNPMFSYILELWIFDMTRIVF